MLAQAMSTANEQWELTDGPATGAVDCVLKDSSNPPRRREVQVVRAIADCKLYQQLAAGNEVIDVNRNPEDVAQWLFDAVTKKAELPEKVRSGLILALDAQRTSVCALYLVIETYRRHFGAQTRSPNFEQVWIVGPTVSMTHRLDM